MERLEERQLLSGFGPEDGAYIVESWSGRYSDVKIQPGDQKIVAAGTISITNPDNTTENRMAIARYDPLGAADTAYGSGGLSAPALGPSGDQGLGLVLQSDGKAVVSGQSSYQASLTVARFTADGSLDSGFGSSGWTSFDVCANYVDYAFAAGLQSTGKIVVAGWSMGSSNSSSVAARFKATGAIDSGNGGFGQVVNGKATGYTLNTFGMLHNTFKDLAVQPDDKVVAVGYTYDASSNIRLVVARYTASGSLDKTFNGRGYSVLNPAGISTLSANDVELQSDGKIVVAGSSSGVDGSSDMLVARYNPNGTLDTSFGGGSGYVRLDVDGTASMTSEQASGLAIQPDGKIVAAGTARPEVAGAGGSVLVARFNPDGTPDSTFGAAGFRLGTPLPDTGYHYFAGSSVALRSDGSIIVGGVDYWSFVIARTDGSTIGTDPHPLLMRFLPPPSSPLLASGGAAPASSRPAPLTLAKVPAPLTAGIARWQATGATVSELGSLDVRLTDLPEATLGLASGNTITLDSNAAGWGWFVGRSWRRGPVPQTGRIDQFSALTTRAV